MSEPRSEYVQRPHVVFIPGDQHRHGEGLGSAATGSVAVCVCGLLLRFGGSTSGMVRWHPMTWRERRRFTRTGRL